jgi:hypothetical protein
MIKSSFLIGLLALGVVGLAKKNYMPLHPDHPGGWLDLIPLMTANMGLAYIIMFFWFHALLVSGHS